jgi:hypothetical protein
METNNTNKKEELPEGHKEYLTELYGCMADAITVDYKSFDKNISYLPFGFIIMYFAAIIFKDSGFLFSWAGAVGCISFSLCIINNMASYFLGIRAANRLRKTVENRINQSIPADEDLYNMLDNDGRNVGIRNLTSFIFLIIGLVFTVIFILTNI